jgi:selenocysteine-specific elongation factor
MSTTGTRIIGTAGHIDHGKTALVRALTGQETDRLPQEKERGISIELGFAHYEIDGTRFGVIDVPGHERFIRQMLAGAHGIDLVLLVVAADDGIMPQTEEHFDIVHLLGAREAIFVITKADLAPDRVAAVRADIEVLACGTRFEHAPVRAVSSVTGEGVDELRDEIARRLRDLPPRESRGYFRLPIDRAFTLHGHGLIATGTAVSGTVRVGDSLAVRPGGLEARARSLQIHGESVAEARSGQRVAVNLGGLSVEEVRRGQWLTDPRVDLTTDRFDCWLEARGGLRQPLKSFERVRVHVATAEVMGRAILLGDRRELGSREAAFAQIALDEPVLVAAGDRFVLRTETATRTTGGGVVVHPFARRYRAGEAELEGRLERLRDGDVAERIAELVDLLHEFAAPTGLVAQALGEVEDAILRAGKRARVIPLPDAAHPEAWTSPAKWERLGTLVTEALEQFHRVHPLEAGMDLEALRSRLRAPLSPRLFRPVIERLAAEGRVVREEALVRLPGYRVKLGAGQSDLADRVHRALREGDLTPPDRKQLERDLETSPERIAEVLRVLERRGDVVRVAPDLFYDRAALDEARRRAVDFLHERPEITVAEYRDLIGASRKYALALLEHFDRSAITLRIGDVRRLRR